MVQSRATGMAAPFDDRLHPYVDAIRQIAREITANTELADVLRIVSELLVATANAALARIWLVSPDAECDVCSRAGRRDTDRALHMLASAGLYTHIDGEHHRIAIGALKVGAIASSGRNVYVDDVLSDARVPAKGWVKRHGLKSFVGFPLSFRDELVGVLGIFFTRTVNARDRELLSVFADEAATAIRGSQMFADLARAHAHALDEHAYLREEVDREGAFDSIIGSSAALKAVLVQVRQVAPTDTPVLIMGETGTGKELVARAIHTHSRRREHALVKVNCAAISPSLMETELFGHERGAFTGAVQRRVGRFELATRGTLFLDEVGELPIETQPKLLRVLQEREFERVGGSSPIRTDARVVAATNRQLEHEVAGGRFRDDLFYRLHVFPIRLPPLRERKADIPELAEHFIARNASRLAKPIRGIATESLDRLNEYSWPGNVRELANVIERACILSTHPDVVVPGSLLVGVGSPNADNHGAPCDHGTAELLPLEEIDRRHIRRVLESTDGRIGGPGGAAEILEMHPNTLRSRMQKLGIRTSRTVRR